MIERKLLAVKVGQNSYLVFRDTAKASQMAQMLLSVELYEKDLGSEKYRVPDLHDREISLIFINANELSTQKRKGS